MLGMKSTEPKNSQSLQSNQVVTTKNGKNSNVFKNFFGRLFTSAEKSQGQKKLLELEAHVKQLLAVNLQLQEFRKAALNVIEQLKSSKAATERLKARDEATLESIGDGVIVTDEVGNIVIMNRAAQKILGWDQSKDQVIGKKWFDVLILEDENRKLLPIDKHPLKSVLSYGKQISGSNYYCIRIDKTKFPAAITSSPVILDRSIVGAVVVFWDITKERELEQAKDYFLSVAAHQLRTPLGSMRWNMQMLLSEDFGKLDEPVKETVQNVYDSNQRMIDLINDLLSVTRIDQQRVRDNPEPTDILGVIKLEIEKLSVETRKIGVTVDLEVKKEDLPKITLDPGRLRAIIQNLLNNAIKYNKQGGKISVRIDFNYSQIYTNSQVEITVSDTGIGIPKKDQEKIFSKFFRAANAVKSETEGSGLGLFVVKAFVEAWGGNISFESTEGKGTTFAFTIPIQPKQYTLQINKEGS